jgi:hypothetical protein
MGAMNPPIPNVPLMNINQNSTSFLSEKIITLILIDISSKKYPIDPMKTHNPCWNGLFDHINSKLVTAMTILEIIRN